MRNIVAVMVALASGITLWLVFNALTGVEEPWDAPTFGYAYALALVLAGGLAWTFPKSGWLSDAIATWAMLPVMAVQSGVGPLFFIGMLLLFLLSIPTAFAGLAMAGLRMRQIARKPA